MSTNSWRGNVHNARRLTLTCLVTVKARRDLHQASTLAPVSLQTAACVRKGEVAELRKLIAAHQRFKAWMNEYEELIVQKTGQEREGKSASGAARALSQ